MILSLVVGSESGPENAQNPKHVLDLIEGLNPEFI
jgi:hypothetical protein